MKNTHEGLKPATLLKLTLLHGCFSRFLNYTNGTKSPNAPLIRRGLIQDTEPVSIKGINRQKDQRLIELAYIKIMAALLSVTLICAMSFLQKRYQLGKK